LVKNVPHYAATLSSPNHCLLLQDSA